MVGEGLRIAGDDGSGKYGDWQQWSAETDGMDSHAEYGYGRTFVVRPVGRMGISAVSQEAAASLYANPENSRLTVRPMETGEFGAHLSPN